MANATLAYDFVNNPSLKAVKGPTLSITRATTATVMGSDGYLKRVASGEARFTGAQRRENIALYSNDFTQANWNKLQCSVAAASGVSPPSGYSGSVYLGTPSGTTGQLYQTFGTPTPGASLVFSVWLKSATGSDITMNIGCNGSGNVVNPINETITVTSEWQRFSITTRVTTPTNTINFIIGGAGASWATGEDIHIFGAQVERVPYGTTTPSEYIPTTTAAVSKVNYAETIASHVSRNGLFVEEARTNICLQSEDFSTTWADANNGVTTYNQTVSPDGSLTADKLSCSLGGAARTFQTITTAVSTAYTFSVYAKADATEWFYLQVNGMAAQTLNCWFNLSAGSIGSTPGSDVTSTFIQNVGNGWYRCGFTFTTDGTDTSASYNVYLALADNATTADTNDSIYIWGAQLEAGAFPTSYIPTTTASATRNVDVVKKTGISAGVFGNGKHSVYINASRFDPSGANKNLLDISDGLDAGANRLLSFSSSATSFNITSSSTGGASAAGSVSATAVLPVDGTFVRWVYAMSTNDLEGYYDGTRVASGPDTSCDGPINLAEINVGSNYLDGGGWNGHIKEIAYWPERLSNVDLAALSNAEQPVFVGAGESVMLDDDFMRRRRMLRRLRR